VGQEPVVTVLESGKKVVRASLATNDHYKNNKGEKVTETQWHTLIAWGKTADIIEKFVAKGKEIAIEGKLTYRSFEDKEGNTRYVTEVVISELLLLGAGK
jgi:single-strand DNA-binding protein